MKAALPSKKHLMRIDPFQLERNALRLTCRVCWVRIMLAIWCRKLSMVSYQFRHFHSAILLRLSFLFSAVLNPLYVGHTLRPLLHMPGIPPDSLLLPLL